MEGSKQELSRSKKRRMRHRKGVKRAPTIEETSDVNIPSNEKLLVNPANVTQNQRSAAAFVQDEVNSKEGLIDLINSMTTSESQSGTSTSPLEISAENNSKASLIKALDKFSSITEAGKTIKKELDSSKLELEIPKKDSTDVAAFNVNVKKEQVDTSTTSQLQQQLLHLFDQSDVKQSTDQETEVDKNILVDLNTSIETLLEPVPKRSSASSQAHMQMRKCSVILQNIFPKTKLNASDISKKKGSTKELDSSTNIVSMECSNQEESSASSKPVIESCIVQIPKKIHKIKKQSSKQLDKNTAEISNSISEQKSASSTETLLESPAIEIPEKIQTISGTEPIEILDAHPTGCSESDVQNESESCSETPLLEPEAASKIMLTKRSNTTDIGDQLEKTEKSDAASKTKKSSFKIPKKKSREEQNSIEIATQKESARTENPVQVTLVDPDSEDEVMDESTRRRRVPKEKSGLSSFKIPRKPSTEQPNSSRITTTGDGDKSDMSYKTPLDSGKTDSKELETRDHKRFVRVRIDGRRVRVPINQVGKIREQTNESAKLLNMSETLGAHLKETGSELEENVAKRAKLTSSKINGHQVHVPVDRVAESKKQANVSAKLPDRPTLERVASEVAGHVTDEIQETDSSTNSRKWTKVKIAGLRRLYPCPAEDTENFEKENFAIYFDKTPLETPLIEISTGNELKGLVEKLQTSDITEIGVNIELFVDQFTYKISVLEISTTDEDYLIDVLALGGNIDVLIEIFLDSKIRKIFDQGRLIKKLQYHWGVEFVNAFAINRVRRKYADLAFSSLQSVFVWNLIGKQRFPPIFKNPTRIFRPLSFDQKQFCRLGTHYLVPVYRSLMHELLKKGKSDCEILLDEAEKNKFSHETQNDYLELVDEIKKHHEDQLRVLNELDEWRHYVALCENLNVDQVLHVKVMKRLAVDMPDDMRTMVSRSSSTFVSKSRELVFKIFNPDYVPSSLDLPYLQRKSKKRKERKTQMLLKKQEEINQSLNSQETRKRSEIKEKETNVAREEEMIMGNPTQIEKETRTLPTECTTPSNQFSNAQNQTSLMQSLLAPLMNILTAQVCSGVNKSAFQQLAASAAALMNTENVTAQVTQSKSMGSSAFHQKAASAATLMNTGNLTAQVTQSNTRGSNKGSNFQNFNTNHSYPPPLMNRIVERPIPQTTNLRGSNYFDNMDIQKYCNPSNPMTNQIDAMPQAATTNVRSSDDFDFQNNNCNQYSSYLPPWTNERNVHSQVSAASQNSHNLPINLDMAIPPPTLQTHTGINFNDPQIHQISEWLPSHNRYQVNANETQTAPFSSGHLLERSPFNAGSIRLSHDSYIEQRNPSPPPIHIHADPSDFNIPGLDSHRFSSDGSQMNSDEENYLCPKSVRPEARSDIIQRQDRRGEHNSSSQSRRRASGRKSRRHRSRSRRSSSTRDGRRKRSSSRDRHGSHKRHRRSDSRETRGRHGRPPQRSHFNCDSKDGDSGSHHHFSL